MLFFLSSPRLRQNGQKVQSTMKQLATEGEGRAGFENESMFFDKYCSKNALFSNNSLMGRLTKSDFGQ